ncbi:Piso0_002382 [Millerozyma farinosa CBS 7064]|uniref:Piso0_002382 protein n=1 Tax=Pichia sorbitophila (strain ATCC MYA-4447 / BCRC 22081 / CBS 7064 / NBRC 10061 / NRRL Y-12695) TaxID=559304 RepID=G8YEW8_PICSO|nr:Piso0_002382 [Millerozyma farinosa CBS 7064]
MKRLAVGSVFAGLGARSSHGVAGARAGARPGAWRFAARRRMSYNYNYQFQTPRSKSSILGRIAFVAFGVAVFSGYVYYAWWPRHTFPSSVAKILRKGLWAESEKGENDYQLALKYYLEALQHCDEIGLDSLSDEYTGIQLKVGEMFERLDMMEDAAFVYNEIATLYLKVLTASPKSEDGRRIRSVDHRAHLIQKDLRLAIKLVELNRNNPQLSKAILMTHLLIAQDEVKRKLGNQSTIQSLTADANSPSMTVTDYKTTIGVDANGTVKTIQKNPSAWEPFSDEFFNAMDLLSATCMFTGDLAMATKVKISMTEWMLIADVDPQKVLLSQCNLASLLYLQAEKFESQEIALRRKFVEDAKHDYDQLKTSPEDENTKNTIAEIESTISKQDKSTFDAVILNKNQCINLALKTYSSVLEFAKSLPSGVTVDEAAVSEIVALATYGLGVVNLHLSDYEKAERFLREARVRSRSCGYDDLISEIERELSKLFEEKKSSSGSKEKHVSGSEMRVQVGKA